MLRFLIIPVAHRFIVPSSLLNMVVVDPADRCPCISLAGCRVLLAEDGPDNQRLVSYLLTRVGAQVAVADNGQIALKMALAAGHTGEPFHVILMDLQMPVLGGCEATERLRAAGYTRPIVALTAQTQKADHDACLRAGCDDVCTKPIDRTVLFDTIHRHWQAVEHPMVL